MKTGGWNKAARACAVVGMVGAGLVGAADGSDAVQPPVTTTRCRVRVHQAVLAGQSGSVVSANGSVNPTAVFSIGNGAVRVELADGGYALLKAEALLCRRDGGRVPEHGGANIADFTGTARLSGDPANYTFQVHVEDRGTGQYDLEDFLAVRIIDGNGDEVVFDANYLESGHIDLVPVRS